MLSAIKVENPSHGFELLDFEEKNDQMKASFLAESQWDLADPSVSLALISFQSSWRNVNSNYATPGEPVSAKTRWPFAIEELFEQNGVLCKMLG